ncbi:putative pre-mrna-splicing factor 38b protein [Phaeoacremonium minimum UCRPA7]|uniref:Putative pre-mrna-splicing factor 38b protein n=1 Tax=Phaeoacremonium minimum (strain UCR-PA7) TaxID=1286976 RepID=R8BR52_PHAM7|nr:putative pre-mrna-splicing factor 38b protein [Phaeoacremonium minimum UCRPA7]EOO01831.1 putative pre-mrna-splicing factor 38b protein [Phaeoacremonium minimum UCRPA7]
MANDELLTDEYVAGLLAKEAKDASAKYSAMGLEAYNSSRPSNKLKPNTRFLRHIIKETKNHNEALLAREAAESQARLQDLAEAEDKKRKRYKPESGAIRNRQLGDIAAILGGKKRRRAAEEEGKEQLGPARASVSGKDDGRLKQDSPPQDEPDEGEDSDPLADIIGPAPPPPTRIRGRGAPGSSAMDSRFSDNYDPKSDVQPDTTAGDDWDDALEALRDRAKWRQQGADRLRAAGFTDEQVSKWEKSGGEKNMDDVQWSRAGEKREWDRGKVLGDDGTIGHGAEWGE